MKIIGPSGYSEFVNQSFFNTTKKITEWILGVDDIFRPIGYIIDSSSGSTASVIAFSTYDKNEAACVEDTTIKIWVLDKNQEWYCKQTLEGHTEPINCIAFSPDATKMTPEIWDIKGQKTLFLNDDKNMWISNQDNDGLLQLDAKILASGSEDTTIKIWVLDENQEWYCKQTLDGHTGPVNCIAFSPGGTTIASGSTNGEIKIWRLCDDNQWYCIATFEANIGLVNSIAFFPYGGMSFACVSNTGMEIWFDKKLWFWGGAEKAIADGFTI